MTGTNATALYDTGANMSCMFLACHTKLNDLYLSEHTNLVCTFYNRTWFKLYGIHTLWYWIVLVDAQFMHTFIICKNLQKELVKGLDMPQVHHLGCDWTENGHMLLHWGADTLIISIDIPIKEPQLWTISNVKVPVCSIVTIPTRKSVLVCQTHCVCTKYKLMGYW